MEEKICRMCPICDKGFSCGRALGGHMRVHSTTAALIQDRNNNDTGDESVACPVCGKEFLALKSLYGHMRCHPERHWRGVLAPYTENPDSIPSWGVTGKRGHRGGFAAVGLDVVAAARNLMCLAGEEQGISEVVFCDEKQGESGFGGDDEDESEVENGVKKRKKGISIGSSVFRCVTCNKEFLSYQALGGHRSKHYKERNRLEAENRECSSVHGKDLSVAAWQQVVSL